jgi:hypothetical protein
MQSTEVRTAAESQASLLTIIGKHAILATHTHTHTHTHTVTNHATARLELGNRVAPASR